MSQAASPERLEAQQYRDAAKLDDRIALHARFSVNPQGWAPWLFEQILESAALPPDAELLELGCGPGFLWCESRRRVPAGWRIALSDFSPGMLEDAKERLDPDAARFTFELIDAVQILRPSACLDGVIANHMLYHVADRPRALAEIARRGAFLVRKDSGVFFARASRKEK